MDLRNAEETTSITRNGTYCFQAMPFELCSPPATFQRLMNVVLSGLNQDILLVYLDDIIIHSTDFESHLERVESFLKRLRIVRLKLKVSRCRSLQSEVHFLGIRLERLGARRLLNYLTRKGHMFVWTGACQEAFNALCESLVTAPILTLPIDAGRIILHADASDLASGAVLSQ